MEPNGLMSHAWSTKDMAEYFKYSTQTVRRKVKGGELPQPDVGNGRGKRRWIPQHVFDFLAERNRIKEEALNHTL
jgi:hypothetical protein